MDFGEMWLPLLASFGLGLVLGLFYFGGLWYTIQAMTRAKRPALLFFASFAVRLGVVLGAIYLIGVDEWQRMVAALVGMILMRIYLTRRLGPLGKVMNN
jgi:F1F0 ATPase subunit 2